MSCPIRTWLLLEPPGPKPAPPAAAPRRPARDSPTSPRLPGPETVSEILVQIVLARARALAKSLCVADTCIVDAVLNSRRLRIEVERHKFLRNPEGISSSEGCACLCNWLFAIPSDQTQASSRSAAHSPHPCHTWKMLGQPRKMWESGVYGILSLSWEC